MLPVKCLGCLALALVTGCSSLSERDKAWYVVHAMDVAQTYQITRSPCHNEVDLITRQLIGDDPSGGEVIVWGIVSALAYHYVKDELPDTVMGLHYAIKLGAVSNNFDIGLGVDGYRCP